MEFVIVNFRESGFMEWFGFFVNFKNLRRNVVSEGIMNWISKNFFLKNLIDKIKGMLLGRRSTMK